MRRRGRLSLGIGAVVEKPTLGRFDDATRRDAVMMADVRRIPGDG